MAAGLGGRTWSTGKRGWWRRRRLAATAAVVVVTVRMVEMRATVGSHKWSIFVCFYSSVYGFRKSAADEKFGCNVKF